MRPPFSAIEPCRLGRLEPHARAGLERILPVASATTGAPAGTEPGCAAVPGAPGTALGAPGWAAG